MTESERVADIAFTVRAAHYQAAQIAALLSDAEDMLRMGGAPLLMLTRASLAAARLAARTDALVARLRAIPEAERRVTPAGVK